MPKRILVIDDERSVRDAFTLALMDSGYAVETAASGEEGVAQAGRERPDLIFLDLRMPGIDGVETLRRLQGCCGDVPVYIVTAFRKDFMDALKKAADDGLAFHVADKPLPADQIRAIVRSVLEKPEVY